MEGASNEGADMQVEQVAVDFGDSAALPAGPDDFEPTGHSVSSLFSTSMKDPDSRKRVLKQGRKRLPKTNPRKREQNRRNAKLLRQKKKNEFADLEERANQLQEENARMQKEVDVIERQEPLHHPSSAGEFFEGMPGFMDGCDDVWNATAAVVGVSSFDAAAPTFDPRSSFSYDGASFSPMCSGPELMDADAVKAEDEDGEGGPTGFCILSSNGIDLTIVSANDKFFETTGYPREEVLGRGIRFLCGPNTSRESVRMLEEAVAAKQSASVEMLCYKRDGSPFLNHLFVTPMRDSGGSVPMFLGVQRAGSLIM